MAPPTSFLVFINGRSEWTEKYHDLRQRLNIKDSCCVVTWDHRGQGLSDGEPYHIDDYKTYVADAKKVIQSCVPDDKDFGIVAHSMGGLIAMLGCLSGQLDPKYLVLTGPLFQIPHRAMNRRWSKPLAKAACWSGLSFLPTGRSKSQPKFKRNIFTNSYRRFKALDQSPLPSQPPTFSWVDATFRATDEILNTNSLSRYRTPTLILAGSKEEVVDYHGFSHWARTALASSKTGQIEYVSVVSGKHELLNETDKVLANVRGKLVGWMQKNDLSTEDFEMTGISHGVAVSPIYNKSTTA